jgi:aminoglycoside N3'-acetyltransferase
MTDKGKYTRSHIIEDLRHLGVRRNDTILLRADLSRLGRTDFRLSEILIDILLEAVGPRGTISTLTFSKTYPVNAAPADKPFDFDTPSNSGSLAKLFLQHPDVLRSRHPSTSFAAIGPNAETICLDHTPDAPPYLPIERLIELDGIMIVMGCVDSSPGFTSVHWAQHQLGLAQQSTRSKKSGVYYRDGDQLRLHRVAAPGGCSLGFWKFYSAYANAQSLFSGHVGDAYSLAIRARTAYEIDRKILEQNPRFALCDNPDCWKCRATWQYNRREMIPFHLRQKTTAIRRLFGFNT